MPSVWTVRSTGKNTAVRTLQCRLQGKVMHVFMKVREEYWLLINLTKLIFALNLFEIYLLPIPIIFKSGHWTYPHYSIYQKMWGRFASCSFIGVGAQWTLGGKCSCRKTFLPEKYVWKINKMCKFYLPEKLSKYPNLYDIFLKINKIPVFYTIFALILHNNCPQNFFPEFGGYVPPAPPSPTPMCSLGDGLWVPLMEQQQCAQWLIGHQAYRGRTHCSHCGHFLEWPLAYYGKWKYTVV